MAKHGMHWIFGFTALHLLVACYFGFNFLFGDELPYLRGAAVVGSTSGDGEAAGSGLPEEEMIETSLRQLLVKIPNYPTKISREDKIHQAGTSYYDEYMFLDRHCTQTLTARKPMFDKMALFIIDALRIDFVPTVIARGLNEPKIPYMERMLKQHGTGMVSVATIPTVTMPRIKALLSGTLPSFMDYIFNLNVQRFTGDSIIEEMWRRNKRINFYGDDTWGKLFSMHLFNEVNLTSSLYATDYTFVDTNVTWNVERQLQRLSDWDVMIMHYLGVDHIGHLQGYHSELFPKKLQEMDNVFRMVFDTLSSNKNSTYLIVVTGDHGMTNSGNHGGNTRDETHTALLFFSTNPEHHRAKPDIYNKNVTVVQQIDFAPTISALFNMNMTAKSEGRIISSVLDRFGMPEQEHLCHLFRNAFQMHRTMLRRHDDMVKLKEPLLDAIKTHYNYVHKLLSNTGDNVHETTQQYLQSTARNRYHLWIENMQKHHVGRVSNRSIFSIMPMCIVLCFLIVLILLSIEYRNDNSIFFSGINDFDLLSSMSAFADNFVARVFDIVNRRRPAIEARFNIFDYFLHLRFLTSTFGRLLLVTPFMANIVFMGSTDWIEEEHFFWYRLTLSILCVILFVVFIGRALTSQWQNMSDVVERHYTQVLIYLLAMIIIFYHLTWWKRTVVHEEDLKHPADYFTMLTAKGRKRWLTSAYLVSLIGIGFGVGWNIKNNISRYIMGAGFFFAYLYRTSLGTISIFRFLDSFLDNFSRWPNLYAQLVYFFVSLLFFWLVGEWLVEKASLSARFGWIVRRVKTLFGANQAEEANNTTTDPSIFNLDDHINNRGFPLMNTILVAWVMMSTLLTPPAMLPVLLVNIVLELFLDFVLSDPPILRNIAQDELNINRRYRIIFTRLAFYLLMGISGYFQMGNTNSLSTISVQACFVGLGSYNVIYCSLFMVIATYSTYVYWVLRFFVWLQQDLFNYQMQHVLPYNHTKKNDQSLDDRHFLNLVVLRLRNRIVLNYHTLRSTLNVVLLFRFSAFTINMLVSFILRDHLFIWSVVCPKLLYEFAFSALNFLLCLVVASIFQFDNSLLLD